VFILFKFSAAVAHQLCQANVMAKIGIFNCCNVSKSLIYFLPVTLFYPASVMMSVSAIETKKALESIQSLFYSL
jgi:hypothetical protein